MRPAKVEILFKAPGLSGNGMQCTKKASGDRQRWEPHGHSGKMQGVSVELRRKEAARAVAGRHGPSGIGVDEDNDDLDRFDLQPRDHSRDAKTGETVEKHFTPGAGVIYRRTTDIAARPDTYGAKARTEAGIPREAEPLQAAGAVAAAPRCRARPEHRPGHE
jgi:hypothetical protein